MCHKSRENFFFFCSCVFCTSVLDPCPHKSHVAIGIWHSSVGFMVLSLPIPAIMTWRPELLQFLPVLSCLWISLLGHCLSHFVIITLDSLTHYLLSHVLCKPSRSGHHAVLCSYVSFLALLGAGLHSDSGSVEGHPVSWRSRWSEECVFLSYEDPKQEKW